MTSKMASEKPAATRELQHTTVATTWYHESLGNSTTRSMSLAIRAKENISRAVEAAENDAKAAEAKRFISCSLSSFCSFLRLDCLPKYQKQIPDYSASMLKPFCSGAVYS